jgi:uncharacterized protein YecE (DUF72 family)
MEFGSLPLEDLNNLTFTLPEDPNENDRILTNAKEGKQQVYLGCPMWGRTEWVNRIYPPRTKEKDFLQHYVKQYNCVELNATHYQLFGEHKINDWMNKAKDNSSFKFCPKMYKGITHAGRLTDKRELVEKFCVMAAAFKEKLGPIFIQLGDNYGPNRQRRKELFDFLTTVPEQFQFFLELRHPEWFLNQNISVELFSILESKRVGLVITDTPGRRDVLHTQLSVPKAFIRLVLNGEHESDIVRINLWAKRIQQWLAKGIEEVFLFLHVHKDERTPDLTKYAAELFNSKYNLNLPQVTFL